MYMHSLETEHWSWITDHEQMLTDHESHDITTDIDLMIDGISTTNQTNFGEYNYE